MHIWKLIYILLQLENIKSKTSFSMLECSCNKTDVFEHQ